MFASKTNSNNTALKIIPTNKKRSSLDFISLFLNISSIESFITNSKFFFAIILHMFFWNELVWYQFKFAPKGSERSLRYQNRANYKFNFLSIKFSVFASKMKKKKLNKQARVNFILGFTRGNFGNSWIYKSNLKSVFERLWHTANPSHLKPAKDSFDSRQMLVSSA